MAKPERGLPKSFDIKVPDGPVQLGDYLDEAPPPPVAASVPAAPPTATLAESITAPIATVAPRLEPPPIRAAAGVRNTPPRKQFNMAPETLRMLEDLLAHVRLYSGERDVRASELVHALVLAVHEVRPHLDLTQVPPRGKWGSASAAALPVALKDAVQKAIAKSRGGR